MNAQNLARISGKKIENNKPVVMYSREGAEFQEYALSMVGANKAHSALIGKLVTAINNGQISVIDAKAEFNDSLWK